MRAFPDLQVLTRCIPNQPEGVYDERTEAEARPKVVELAREMEREGMSAIFISCAGDPGLEESRKVVKLPVIGAGCSAALLALGLGNRVGSIGITDEIPENMARLLGKSLVAYKKPYGIKTALDLLHPKGKSAVLESAAKLKSEGVDVISLACTGMSTIGMATLIKKEIGLHVVDPVIAGGLFTWYAVQDI